MGSASGIRAGRAYVELYATDNALIRTLDRAKARMQSFASAMGKVGVQAGTGGGAVLAPLGKALSDAVTKGADIKKIATRFGETTESVSSLAAAFQVAGSDMDEFGSSMDGLKGKIKAAADANGLFDDQMRSVGNARALEKLPLEKQLETLTKALQRIEDDTQRAIKAQEWFGESGKKMLPFLAKGGGGFSKMMSEGIKSGGAMTADDIERSAAASKALNTIWVELKNTVVALGTSLLPTTDQTKDITTQIREVFSESRKWIAENKNLIIAVAGVGAGLVAAGASLVAFKAVVLTTVAVVSGAFAALGLLFTPAGMILVGIAGVTAAFLTLTNTGKQTTADLGESFRGMGQTFSETFGGIVTAVKAGDLQGAFEIAGAGIKAVWREMLLALRRSWNDFVKWMVQIIKDNPALLPIIGAAVGTAVGGPLGTAAGLAAGVGANFIDFERMLTTDTQAAEMGVKQAKDDLRALLGKQVGKAGGGIFEDPETQKRFEEHGNNLAKDLGKIPETLASAQKGVFAGPIGQQLGIGDKVAQRQLDAINKVDENTKKTVEALIALGQNVAVFKRG